MELDAKNWGNTQLDSHQHYNNIECIIIHNKANTNYKNNIDQLSRPMTLLFYFKQSTQYCTVVKGSNVANLWNTQQYPKKHNHTLHISTKKRSKFQKVKNALSLTVSPKSIMLKITTPSSTTVANNMRTKSAINASIWFEWL